MTRESWNLDYGPFTGLSSENDSGRRLLDCGLDHPGWEANPLTLYFSTGSIQNLESLRMIHFHTGPFQYVQRGLVNPTNLFVADNPKFWLEIQFIRYHSHDYVSF